MIEFICILVGVILLVLTTQSDQHIQKTSSTIPVLGITVNEERWLIPMRDIKEILLVPSITPVFLTQPWFLGVVNIRGIIYGISDLNAYLNKEPVNINVKTRIFLLASYLGTGYALLAENMLGIRDLTEFTLQSDSKDQQPVVAAQYQDRQNRCWHMLNLSVLMQLDSFLDVSR